MAQNLLTVLLILASMSFTVLGNLALKTGAERNGLNAVWPLSVLNSQVVIAAGAFALAFLFYAMLLKRLPLSLAQAIMSVQFVLVILAANLLLHESVGMVRWLGIGLMAIGLLVVGISPEAKPAPPVAIHDAQ